MRFDLRRPLINHDLFDLSHKKHSRWPSQLPPHLPQLPAKKKNEEKEPRHSEAICCGKNRSLNRKIRKYFTYLRNGYKANKRKFVSSYMVRAVCLRLVEKTAGPPNNYRCIRSQKHLITLSTLHFDNGSCWLL